MSEESAQNLAKSPQGDRPQDNPSQDGSLSTGLEERAYWHLLPWMTKMVMGLTLFFFLASAAQLIYLHFKITAAPETDLEYSLAMMEDAGADGAKLTGAALAALSVLELGVVERRYHQANVSLLSRVWTRYLGFVTGMVLAMVGAVFILGRLETKAASQVRLRGPEGTTGHGALAEITSQSPGLVLVSLGVALMITTIVTHHEIQVQDQAVYAKGWSLAGGTSQGKQTLSQKESEPANGGGQGVAPNPGLPTPGADSKSTSQGAAGVTR